VIMELRKRLEELTQTIRQHPLLEIYEHQQSSGVDSGKFNDFRKSHGFDVPQIINDAYTEINGFTIVYGLKDNSDQGLAKFNSISKDYMVEKGPPYIVGSIKFLTFEMSFLENTWQTTLYDIGSASDNEKFHFRKKEYTYNDFGKQLKPFDLFSEETCAAFLLIPEERFEVVLLTDHYADWKSSRIISFEDYWSLIFQTGGIIDARERHLSEAGGDELRKVVLPQAEKIKPRIFSK
jgi:hypothetical protein